jgi:aryl-alcohol dehydrogenase-like predicted oxidoreductase
VEKRTLGKTGMQVSVLGFGGAEIGFENAPLADVERLLNSALDAGLNVIDTAAMYRDSEVLIGQAVAGRRKDFFLFTKCGAAGGNAWSPANLIEDIDRSLRNLRTDHLDLLQLHSCSEELLRQGDVIEVVEKARAAGKTRFVGYSGDRSAAVYAIRGGRFDTLQTSVNVADQEAIDLVLPDAVKHNVGVIVKRPIANAVWRYAARPENWYHQEYWDRMQKLVYPWSKDPAAAAEMALRFTLGQPGVSTMIVGTKTPNRWQENAKTVAKGPLPKEEVEAIHNRWKQVAGANWVGQT